MSPLILPARPADLPAIQRVADAVFPVPWPLSELQQELTRAHATVRVLRVSQDTPIVGFVNHWQLGDELQIMNIATEPAMRRRGYGRALLNDVVRDARVRRLRAVSLEVRASNEPALALYASAGFERLGRRPRYYSDNGEDAVLMLLTV